MSLALIKQHIQNKIKIIYLLLFVSLPVYLGVY